MVRNDEGLTKTYNRFHDPYENDPEIAKLRELHAAMDRAVLDAYGWTDIPTDCEFLLDYEIDEEEWGNRKKPYRYRWPDDVRSRPVPGRSLRSNCIRSGKRLVSDRPRTAAFQSGVPQAYVNGKRPCRSSAPVGRKALADFGFWQPAARMNANRSQASVQFMPARSRLLGQAIEQPEDTVTVDALALGQSA